MREVSVVLCLFCCTFGENSDEHEITFLLAKRIVCV